MLSRGRQTLNNTHTHTALQMIIQIFVNQLARKHNRKQTFHSQRPDGWRCPPTRRDLPPFLSIEDLPGLRWMTHLNLHSQTRLGFAFAGGT